jgi:hypothetical protein
MPKTDDIQKDTRPRPQMTHDEEAQHALLAALVPAHPQTDHPTYPRISRPRPPGRHV